ncbi:MAG TPA: sigma-54-dependent Fis family transcriptional regulator [candidate division Zixibacteria bacterium]|nr:sigma-54-dependent Fis family transcriptional regulator [candidate division Zixibacteria bacterium]
MQKKSVLVVDDDPQIVKALGECLEGFDYGMKVATNGAEALLKMADPELSLVLLDVNLPDYSGLDILNKIKESNSNLPVIIMTGFVSTEAAIDAMKGGAYEFVTKPFNLDKITTLITRVMKKSTHLRGLETFSREPNFIPGGLIGRSSEMMEIAKMIGQVAATDASVLILGESGTGKELVAKSIYRNSLRKDKPFLSVNCAALPETLLESELFGHEKGSFTGAYSRKLGKFEVCSGGTLLLDEIADMSALTQSKVLRVLQEQEFERVGGTDTIKVDVRIIAATNKSLVNLIKENKFRVDLFYRLKVVSIYLPPLRERRSDIPILCDHFINTYSEETGKEVHGISKTAMDGLMRYPWPGNVRELENNIHTAVVMAKGDILLPEDFPVLSEHRETIRIDLEQIEADYAKMFADILNPNFEKMVSISGNHLYHHLQSGFEKALMSAVLKFTGSNQVKASELLGISRNTLRDRISKYGLY